MYTKLKVTLYASTGDTSQSDITWSGTGVDLPTAYDVKVNRALGGNKESFSFKILNTRNIYKAIPKATDKVTIHLLINGESASDDNLLMVGVVKSKKENTANARVLNIEGVSYGDIVTQGLVFYTAESVNVMEFLEGALGSVKLRNSNYGLIWGTNPTLKDDAVTAFPDFTKFKEFDKSLKDVLNRYLTNDWTVDGKYYWYVTPSQTLEVRKRKYDNTSGVLLEGVNFKNAQYYLNSDDVKNFIIVKCGYDWDNNPISARYDNASSRAKFGFKYHMIIDTQIAEKLKKTYDSNSTLIPAVRTYGEAVARAYGELSSKGYMTIKIVKEPTINYQVGDIVEVYAPSYNINSLKALRVSEISWDIHGTILTLKEEAQV